MEITDWLLVVFTGVMVFFARETWRIAKNINFLTGALETHSLLMLRMTLKKDHPKVKAIWWDPSLSKNKAPTERLHGKEAKLETVHLFVPRDQRKY